MDAASPPALGAHQNIHDLLGQCREQRRRARTEAIGVSAKEKHHGHGQTIDEVPTRALQANLPQVPSQIHWPDAAQRSEQSDIKFRKLAGRKQQMVGRRSYSPKGVEHSHSRNAAPK